MPRLVALLDANVLYPARVRDLLIRLAIAGLYQARWSEQILDECFDNLLGNRPDLTDEQLARARQLMTTALPDATVAGYEDRIEENDLPDPDDRHVLAAAVTAGASLLVTNNLGDFPRREAPRWATRRLPRRVPRHDCERRPRRRGRGRRGPGRRTLEPADDDDRATRRAR